MMYQENSGEDSRNIVLSTYDDGSNPESSIVYKGDLKFLYEYMQTHDHLEKEDDPRIFCDIMNVKQWEVVEVLVYNEWEGEKDIPDYNKAKLITIV